MKIGIHATNHRRDGGQFQFLTACLDALHDGASQHEFHAFYFLDGDNLQRRYAGANWRWHPLPRPPRGLLGPKLGPPAFAAARALWRRLGFELVPLHRPAQAGGGGAIRSALAAHNLDLMLYPQWTDGCWNWGVPYVCVVHDLQHRLQPEFAEVSLFGKWAQREQFFSRALGAALRVVVDSAVGKEHVEKFYGVDASRLRVLPYTVPPVTEPAAGDAAAAELDLPPRYFLYPAHFWPHKNHYRVVEAVGLLKKEHGLEVEVVLPGGGADEWGVRDTCRRLAEAYGVAGQVRFPGYVTDAALRALYRNAVGLVMPTYFGPTNIPYLEAFQHRCPVIASDLPGIRDQIGEAGLLVDPGDSRAIAGAMRALWTEAGLRTRLVAAGERQLEQFSPARFRAALLGIVEEAVTS